MGPAPFLIKEVSEELAKVQVVRLVVEAQRLSVFKKMPMIGDGKEIVMCWSSFLILFPSLVVHAIPCSRPLSTSMSLWLVHERIEANEQAC